MKLKKKDYVVCLYKKNPNFICWIKVAISIFNVRLWVQAESDIFCTGTQANYSSLFLENSKFNMQNTQV